MFLQPFQTRFLNLQSHRDPYANVGLLLAISDSEISVLLEKNFFFCTDHELQILHAHVHVHLHVLFTLVTHVHVRVHVFFSLVALLL